MDTFTQPKIAGYRQLNEQEAYLMNECKNLAAECGVLVAKLRQFSAVEPNNNPADAVTVDQRWVSIGATDLQTGFMALVRAIAQPTTF